MMDLSTLVDALAAAGPDAPVRFRRGSIIAVAADGSCTITVAGGTAQVAGVKVASGCCPVPGASCWIATDGRDMYVMDTLAPNGPAYGSMRQNAAQTIGTGAFTAISWTTRTETTATGVTLGSNGITCTVPGLYTVSVSVTLAANATGQRHLVITHNGANEVQGYSTNAPAGSDICRMGIASTFKLALGDVVNAEVYQSSGGNLATQIAAGHNIIRAVWVGPAA